MLRVDGTNLHEIETRRTLQVARRQEVAVAQGHRIGARQQAYWTFWPTLANFSCAFFQKASLYNCKNKPSITREEASKRADLDFGAIGSNQSKNLALDAGHE